MRLAQVIIHTIHNVPLLDLVSAYDKNYSIICVFEMSGL